MITSLAESSDGLVWVTVRIAAPDAAAIPVQRDPSSEGGRRITDEYRDRVLNTILDVLDPAAGRLVARRQLPGEQRLANDGTLVRPIFLPGGLLQFEVSRIRVRR